MSLGPPPAGSSTTVTLAATAGGRPVVVHTDVYSPDDARGKCVYLSTEAGASATRAPMTFAEAGAVIAGLRDARRELLKRAPWKTIERAVDVVLVESELGAFGVGCDGTDEPFEWYDSRGEARAAFSETTDHGWCESCETLFSRDDLREAGEDGPLHCPPCYAAALADYLAAPAVHVDPSKLDPCPWTGTIRESEVVDDDYRACPKCGEEVAEALGAGDFTAAPAPSAGDGHAHDADFADGDIELSDEVARG